MRRLFYGYAILSLSLCALLSTNTATAKTGEKRIIVGYVENVRIQEADQIIKAKLDTGAKTSSINAKIIETKKDDEDEKEYVVFSIKTKEKNDKTFKKPIIRWVKIKGKEGEESARRPIVKMNFCIAGQLIEEEVNLAKRTNFIYDLLIGRNLLEKGLLVVDVSKTFTAKPNCIKIDKKD